MLGDAAYSPDGTRIITTSKDGTARIWDADTGQELRTLTSHTGQVRSAAFSPDGKYIVIAGCDYADDAETCRGRSTRIWNAERARLHDLAGHTAEVLSAAYSPDGMHIVTASADGTARIWDPNTGQEERTLPGHTNWVWSAAYSPDGKMIATEPGRIRPYLGRRCREGSRPTQGSRSWIWSAAYSPDGQHILTASADWTARIWDVASNLEVRELLGHTAGSGRRTTARMVSTSSPRVSTGPPASGMPTPEKKCASSAATATVSTLRPTARTADTSSPQVVTRLPASGTPIPAKKCARSRATPTASYRRTTARTASISSPPASTGPPASGTRPRGGNYASSMPMTPGSGAAAYSPDGTHIVTAGCDQGEKDGACRSGSARIWDAATGQALRPLTAYTGRVRSAAYSPDGTYIVTAGCDWANDAGACQDGSTRIWNAETGQALRTLSGHTGEVLSAAYSPDGRHLVTASAGGIARIWAASIDDLLEEAKSLIQQVPPSLTPDERRRYGVE